MIESHIKEYNLKAIKEHFKTQGIFYTPRELALMLKDMLMREIGDVYEVYDPTCGRGALLDVFDDSVIKYGQDINANEIAVAMQTIPNFKGVAGDTLKNPAWTDKKFKAIIANPPFSIAWDNQSLKNDERFKNFSLAPKSKADYAFILHCLHYLADDGCAVVVNSPGILYRGNSEGKIRHELCERNLISEIVMIPSDTFVDTSIATCVLILKKNKTDTDIVFTDKKQNRSTKVSFDEIKNENFTLNFTTFLPEPNNKKAIDIKALNAEIRALRKSNQKKLKEWDEIVLGLERLMAGDDVKLNTKSRYIQPNLF